MARLKVLRRGEIVGSGGGVDGSVLGAESAGNNTAAAVPRNAATSVPVFGDSSDAIEAMGAN